MQLVKIDLIKRIEGYSKKRVKLLKEKILKDGVWIKPICIEKNHFLVLDGMHRFEVAKELNFRFVPCELFDYRYVDVWSLRKNHQVSKELVVKKALIGDIYPYKTAKHKFPIRVEDCMIPLKEFENFNKYEEDIIDYKFKRL